MRRTGLRQPEAALLAVGLMLLAVFLGFRVHSFLGSRAALRKFADVSSRVPESSAVSPLPDPHNVDFALWSEERIKAYRESLTAAYDGPIAVLTIRKLSLQVPVFNGTDELVLNRGVGRILGTARPGQAGNVGIAGHRDGFFRGLKDLQIGDRIELATWNRTTTYAVDTIDIVHPEDVSVLQPKEHATLTLVTCYPFYFVGHAPERYIVRASITGQNLPRNPKRIESKPIKQEVINENKKIPIGRIWHPLAGLRHRNDGTGQDPNH